MNFPKERGEAISPRQRRHEGMRGNQPPIHRVNAGNDYCQRNGAHGSGESLPPTNTAERFTNALKQWRPRRARTVN